eukprot:g28753.t1
MEVQGRYYCEYCNKHLNDNTLEAHIDSEAHKKKHAWATPALAGPPAPPPVAAPRGPAPAPPLTASLSPVCPPVAHLLDWQQVGPDGLVRCIPCNKAWREYERLKKTGHPAPELEYLAWVPSIDGDPNSEKWKKCLLCKKWVQDETSHCGTAANPQGSKEHQKLGEHQVYSLCLGLGYADCSFALRSQKKSIKPLLKPPGTHIVRSQRRCSHLSHHLQHGFPRKQRLARLKNAEAGCTVRSNRKGNIGFVRDKRRLNVAITRARLRLWVIGDLTTLAAGDDTWRQFINFCKVRKLVQDVPSDRTQTERNVERLVRQGSGGYGPGLLGTGGGSKTRRQPNYIT